MRALLERIADYSRRGEPLEATYRMALAVGIQSWLSGSCDSLDEAFQVKRSPGQRSNAFFSRDQLIRHCAANYYATSVNVSADLVRDWGRYTSSAWRQSG